MELGDFQAKAQSLAWMTSEYQGERKTHLEVTFVTTKDRRSIPVKLSFGSAKGVDFAMKQLRECGFAGTDVTKIRSAQDLPNEVTVRVKQGEYNGKPQIRTSVVTPFDAQPATEADLRALSTKLSGAKVADVFPAGDDDCPF